MNTIQLDNGILNNYAAEPETYYAVFPSSEQARAYLYQGALGFALIATTLLVSWSVS